MTVGMTVRGRYRQADTVTGMVMAKKVKPLTDLDIRRAKAGEVKRDG